MDSLPVFLTLEGRPVILLGDGVGADAKARLLGRAGAHVVRDEAADARVAIVAIADQATAEAAVRRLKARGILVNAVDRPALCDFTLPAIVDRSPVIIAIGTSGASASLAKALRQWLERMLPVSLGHLALSLKGARARIAARHPDGGCRRAFLDGLLAPGGGLDPLTCHSAPEAVLSVALNNGNGLQADALDRTVLDRIVLASADPDDLTLRTARLLAAADRVYYRPDVPAAIVDRARADAERVVADGPPASLPPGRAVFLQMAVR